MKKIVITSINYPTEAVRMFSKLKNFSLIVVGDKKTPPEWSCAGVEFISAESQGSLNYKIIQKMPFNHYSRKMIGYLNAIENGAHVIIDTDDDNLPLEGYGFPEFDGNFETIPFDQGFVYIYKLFTKQHIWPRGFPLKLINSARNNDIQISPPELCKVGIWQGLADKDPDVDAIYRLVDGSECVFQKRLPIVLTKGTYCPFNSQNTAYRKELFELLYLPAYVTFRFTDILRGLVAQPIMEALGYRLGFLEATVEQLRNPHDYLKDFESEIPCYLLPEKINELARSCVNPENSVGQNLRAVYSALFQAGVVPQEEIELLDCWLIDLQQLNFRQ